MWVAQYFPFHFARQFLSSSGLGTMGFGLPAAIGAQIAHPDKTVFNITGDGSFMMNLQELSTVKRYGLPIKIVMFNNRHLGLVRQQQELFYGQRYSEVDLSDNPDFPELVKSFGFTSGSISSTSETAQATSWLKNCPGPVFLEVNIPANENVWPFVIPGQSNSHRLNDPGEHKNAI
jgi:acetolactate synthase-1/2/3 large subunit